MIDKDEAELVRRIFDLAVAGNGYERIAKILTNEQVLTPSARGRRCGRRSTSPHKRPYDWHYSTIRTILNNEAYLGHTVQGRFTTVSYKVKKVVKIPEEQWVRAENTHEPIIEQKVWDMVQGIIHKRKRSTKRGAPHIFAGLLRCADYGNTLSKNAKDVFGCWQYRTKGKGNCTNHHITMEQLKAAVLASIRKVSKENPAG